MKVFLNKRMTPHGGYDYQQPYTDPADGKVKTLWFKGYATMGPLVKRVTEFRKSNGMALGDIYGEIEEEYCGRHPEFCRDTNQPAVPKGKIETFTDALKGWANQGFACVPEDVVHQRQDICLKCEHFKGWRQAGIGYCKKCGCAVGKVQIKLLMPDQSCPLNKWGKWSPQ